MGMGHTEIRALIREVVDHTKLADPGDIAVQVAAKVPSRELRGVLGVVLREYVRTQLHSFRSWRRSEPESEVQDSPAASKTLVGVPGQRSAPAPGFSAKVAAIRELGRQCALILDQPVAVEGNAWKRFGTCSVRDLDFLVLHRRRNAAESIAAAQRFEKYRAAMEEHGADTVADLSDEVIEAIEDGA